jgi:hypothetical protein
MKEQRTLRRGFTAVFRGMAIAWWVPAVCFSCLAVLATWAMPVGADQFDTIYLGLSSSNNRSPQINDQGLVVWAGYQGGWQIYEYDSSTCITTQLTNNTTGASMWDLHLSSTGDIAWQQYSSGAYHVMLYSGGSISQVDSGLYSSVTNLGAGGGKVAWCTDGHIYVNGADYGIGRDLEMSANGNLVWVADEQVTWHPGDDLGLAALGFSEEEIHSTLFNDGIGGSSDMVLSCQNIYLNGVNVSHNQMPWIYPSDPDVNSQGAVAWTQAYYWSPTVASYEILENGAPITNHSASPVGSSTFQKVMLGDGGQVVWQQYGEVSHDQYPGFYCWILYYYNGSVTHPPDHWHQTLPAFDYDGFNYDLNAQGELAFQGGNYDLIYLYSGGATTAASDYYNGQYPKINSQGQVTWAQGLDSYCIYLYTGASPVSYTRYDFTYYYDNGTGDSYSGYFYAQKGTYLVNDKETTTDENNREGYYEITGASDAADASLLGDVFVTSYYDQETGQTYTPVSNGTAVGADYLGSEYDYILRSGISDFYFGGGYYEADLPSYFVYDHWGGTWHDANKTGTNDTLLCWAAVAANILGWGNWDTSDYNTETLIFKVFTDYWTDAGSWQEVGWRWWVDGTEPAVSNTDSYVDVEGAGNYWLGINFNDYYGAAINTPNDLMKSVDNYFINGYGVGAQIIALSDGHGHAITIWGFDYYDNKDTNTRSYLGMWITDSDDDDTGGANLKYVPVTWDNTNNRYAFTLYGNDWYLNYVDGFKINPNPVAVYDFTYFYAGGDYYTGKVYAENGKYTVNQTINTVDENGQNDYYQITGVTYTGDTSKYGDVYVSSYYDAESDKTFTPVSNGTAVGTNYLASEHDYIIKSGVSEYYFGGGYYDADLVSYAYAFLFTYGSGDYYTGTVYAEPEYGYSASYTMTTTDEKGNTDTYAITGVTTGYDVSRAGQVYVSSYYDAGSNKTYTPVSGGTAGGANYLTSEHGYIIQSGVPEFYFGGGYYEADTGAYSRYDFYYWYSDGSGDCYAGYVYAPTGWLTAGTYLYHQPLPMGGAALGGCYYITSATAGYTSAYDKQSYITTYYDYHNSAWTACGVNSDGTATAGSIYVADRSQANETGYAIYSSSAKYFDTATSFTYAASMPAASQAVWAAYWSQTPGLLDEGS